MNINSKEILSLADLKLKKVSELLEKTKLQSIALKEQNIDKLNEIADEKQILINNFDKINKSFNDKLQTFKEQGNGLENLKPLKEIIDEIKKSGNEIYEIELANKSELIKQMEKVKEDIKKTSVEKKGLKAYFQQGINNSRYIDQKN